MKNSESRHRLGIHFIVNANATKLTTGESWVIWANNARKKFNISYAKLERIAFFLTE